MKTWTCLAALMLIGCTQRVDDEQMKRIIDRLDAIEAKQGVIINGIEDVQSEIGSIDCDCDCG